MLRSTQRLSRLASAAPLLLRRFCASPPQLRSPDDGATACCVRDASAGRPVFGVFATSRTLTELGGAASFVDLPPVNTQLLQGRFFAMLESSLGRRMLTSPLTGEVLRRNEALLAAAAPATAAPPSRPGALPAPLWLLDVTCEDDSEWQALQPEGGAPQPPSRPPA